MTQGVEDAVQPADDSANDEGDIALAVEDADGYTQINTAQDLYDYLQKDKNRQVSPECRCRVCK